MIVQMKWDCLWVVNGYSLVMGMWFITLYCVYEYISRSYFFKYTIMDNTCIFFTSVPQDAQFLLLGLNEILTCMKESRCMKSIPLWLEPSFVKWEAYTLKVTRKLRWLSEQQIQNSILMLTLKTRVIMCSGW